MMRYRLFAAVTIAAVTSATLSVNAAEFFRLSDYIPDLQYSRVTDVSADGSTVVGEYSLEPLGATGQRSRAFVWELGVGITTLEPTDPNFPSAVAEAYAYRIAADGTVLGQVDSLNSPGATFLWKQGEGFTYLPPEISFGSDLSGDGTTVVAANGAEPIYLWTKGSGLTSYALPGEVVAWTVRGMSDNGQFVTGSMLDNNGFLQGFRWDFDGPLDILPPLGALGSVAGVPPLGGVGDTRSEGFDVSDNGIVAAFSTTADGFASYRWTESGGEELLGEVGPVPYSSNPLDISPTGNIIVGDANDGPGFNGDAFLWVQGIGNRSIEQIVEASGYDMSEWNLGAAAVSDNGRVIAGLGINPDGLNEGWVATLAPSEVPEPSCLVLLTFGGLVGVAAFRRKAKIS